MPLVYESYNRFYSDVERFQPKNENQKSIKEMICHRQISSIDLIRMYPVDVALPSIDKASKQVSSIIYDEPYDKECLDYILIGGLYSSCGFTPHFYKYESLYMQRFQNDPIRFFKVLFMSCMMSDLDFRFKYNERVSGKYYHYKVKNNAVTCCSRSCPKYHYMGIQLDGGSDLYAFLRPKKKVEKICLPVAMTDIYPMEVWFVLNQCFGVLAKIVGIYDVYQVNDIINRNFLTKYFHLVDGLLQSGYDMQYFGRLFLLLLENSLRSLRNDYQMTPKQKHRFLINSSLLPIYQRGMFTDDIMVPERFRMLTSTTPEKVILSNALLGDYLHPAKT